MDILRGRGIELYNGSLEDLSKSGPVVDDILEQQKIEEQMPPRKRKTYEALRHDITLWHLVARRRPVYLEAPLDATYWIGTVDHWLIAFDQQKRSRDGVSVPVCVHPATLIQMLQLWIPRSERLDAALFDSLRAALPHSFDSADEEMTLRILRALSRYEDVDDLPESMITSILMNQALRVSVQGESEVSEQVSLVRDEIIRAAGEVKRKLVEEEGRAQELSVALEKAKQDASASGKRFHEVDKKAAELEEKLREERLTRSELETRLAAIEGVLRSEQVSRADEEAARKLAAIRTRVLVGAVLALIAVVLGSFWLRHEVAAIRDSSLYSAAFLIGSLATWLTAVLLVGARVKAVSEWSVFVRFRFLAKVVGGVLWTLVTGAAGNALWEWAKTH